MPFNQHRTQALTGPPSRDVARRHLRLPEHHRARIGFIGRSLRIVRRRRCLADRAGRLSQRPGTGGAAPVGRRRRRGSGARACRAGGPARRRPRREPRPAGRQQTPWPRSIGRSRPASESSSFARPTACPSATATSAIRSTMRSPGWPIRSFTRSGPAERIASESARTTRAAGSSTTSPALVAGDGAIWRPAATGRRLPATGHGPRPSPPRRPGSPAARTRRRRPSRTSGRPPRARGAAEPPSRGGSSSPRHTPLVRPRSGGGSRSRGRARASRRRPRVSR